MRRSCPYCPSLPALTQPHASQWNGTVDWSPYLSTAAALDFRRDVLGGEERITEYCHKLAIEGGELFARVLGTETMRNQEGEGELVANMVSFGVSFFGALCGSRKGG